jgi:hypothetical protein
LIKTNEWLKFTEEIEKVSAYFSEYYSDLKGDNAISFKHDYVDYLNELTKIDAPTKYKIKIKKVTDDVSKLTPIYRLDCNDVLKCHTNADRSTHELSLYKKDFIKSDNWMSKMAIRLEERKESELFDIELALKTLSAFDEIRLKFINIMAFCLKNLRAESELFNANVAITVKINRLNEILGYFVNKSFAMPSKEINNTKFIILAVSDEFYKNLKHKHQIDFSKTYYHHKIQKFISEINGIEISKLQEATSLEKLPKKLKANKVLSKKEKILLHELMLKFGDSGYGTQRVFKFLLNENDIHNIHFRLKHKEFNALINEAYELKFKTYDNMKVLDYLNFKEEMIFFYKHDLSELKFDKNQ